MRRARLMVAALVVGGTTLVAGCQGGDEPKASSSTSQSPSISDSPSESTETESPDSSGPSNADLDAFVAQGRQALKSMMSADLKKTYSSIKIQPDYPSGITYVYVFRKSLDPDLAAKSLDKSASILQQTFKSSVGPALEAQGFENPTVTWTYLNPDGTTLWSKKFE